MTRRNSSQRLRSNGSTSAGAEAPSTDLERLLADAEWVDSEGSVFEPLRRNSVREFPGSGLGYRRRSGSPPGHHEDTPSDNGERGPDTHNTADFDTVIAEASREEDARRPFAPRPLAATPRRSAWGLVVAAGVSILGIGLVAGSAIALKTLGGTPTASASTAVDESEPVAAPTPVIPPDSAAGQGRPAAGQGHPEEQDGISALVNTSWSDPIAAEAGIPHRAMRAYAGAAIRLSAEQPGCGIGWNTLAGIGLVESEHGTINGGGIAQNGQTAPPIVGIPLDGTSTDRIPDTDGGALDGDPQWDRAVGPMQFIPSTWADWAADGSGDGVADPQNIDDSALAAARYLCHVGGDLRQADNWISAVAAYNNTVEYNNRVAEAADHYAAIS